MTKLLIMTIQANLVPNPVKCGEGKTNSPELSLLKFLPLGYHHRHLLATSLDFTSCFTAAFLGATPISTAVLF